MRQSKVQRRKIVVVHLLHAVNLQMKCFTSALSCLGEDNKYAKMSKPIKQSILKILICVALTKTWNQKGSIEIRAFHTIYIFQLPYLIWW